MDSQFNLSRAGARSYNLTYRELELAPTMETVSHQQVGMKVASTD